MNIDRVKEQIKFNTEIIKLIVVLMIATGGGALSLIITGLTHARDVILAAIGMILAIICWVITFKRYKVTQDLINKL
ncbi:hypothetical protein KK083_23625 [Fulvivirgaceae bacterium PWU4]|uniref:Uncharacterized protein n=1 Tax=Chryseosolibacter histidini TaxID=2782349 RepID=A0AAP2DRY5_9BACT|nr:hypothetical protein [Chryseosolibacter histidini]MBT1699897.1 hypothetical protein [Chryseosolibacter histidini]